jgi:hypothetical protein
VADLVSLKERGAFNGLISMYDIRCQHSTYSTHRAMNQLVRGLSVVGLARPLGVAWLRLASGDGCFVSQANDTAVNYQ